MIPENCQITYKPMDQWDTATLKDVWDIFVRDTYMEGRDHQIQCMDWVRQRDHDVTILRDTESNNILAAVDTHIQGNPAEVTWNDLGFEEDIWHHNLLFIDRIAAAAEHEGFGRYLVEYLSDRYSHMPLVGLTLATEKDDGAFYQECGFILGCRFDHKGRRQGMAWVRSVPATAAK